MTDDAVSTPAANAAERIRARASCSALSGRPTMVQQARLGSAPSFTYTSTSTGVASRPVRAKAWARVSMSPTLAADVRPASAAALRKARGAAPVTLRRHRVAEDAHAPAVDRHDIDARAGRPPVTPLEHAGRTHQPLGLRPRQRVRGRHASAAAPPLHLHDDEQASPPADEVDLPRTGPHVAPDDQVPVQEVEQRGEQLAIAPRLRWCPTQPARSARRSAGGHDTVRVA